MSAVVYRGSGRIELEEPSAIEAGPDERVVEVRYAGVNPLDARFCSGALDRAVELPFIPGTEGSAVLDGQPVLVYGAGVGTTRPGTFQSRVTVPVEAIHPLPPSFDLVQAAALGTAGVTAWSVVNSVAGIGAGDDVLVLGASGGVGSVAVQLAVAAGARVTGQTAHESKAAALEGLGATPLVAATPDEVAASGVRPNVVLDPLGGGYTAAAMTGIRTGGSVVVFGASAGASGPIDFLSLYRKSCRVLGYASMREDRSHVERAVAALAAMVEDGTLTVPIHEVMPLDRVEDAFAALGERRVVGKVVLETG